LGAAAILGGPVAAQSVADFYKGKTVEVYIGYSVGGGYDAYARLLVRHMGRHIPGNPTLVPVNMPGAGSLKLTNWLYEAAPRDGTAFGTVARAAPFDPLFGTEGANFDARNFTYIGSMNNEVSVCVAHESAGINNVEDLKKKELFVGGTGDTADTVQFPKLINATLGTKMTIINGYPGGNDVMLAMERGEVNGRCGWSWSSVKSTRMEWYEKGVVKVLLQMSTAKHPELPDVPLVTDLASGEDQQLLKLAFARQALGRPFIGPPGIPEDRARALQEAFMKTMTDPEFLKEAAGLDMEITPVSGPDVRQLVIDAYDYPKSVIERMNKILG
jgi:tripartite-type tricarboxylate transporter receptor subunit TctC